MQFIDLAAQQRRIRPEIDATIRAVLDHGAYIMGPEIDALERALATRAGARHAVSCASGTDALLMTMLALAIGRGDAVLCPAFTYTATPESIALVGAAPVFVDVDETSFNVDPAGLEAGLAAARAAGLRPKAIVAVDLFGQPANYPAVNAFAQAEGLHVIADAAQSFGASLGGKPVGALAPITTASFFPAKPLGCYGDGGAIFTDDDGIAESLRSIRLHGKGADKYDVVRLGVNGRLDTIQAAILLCKLAIFDEEITLRQAVADRYDRALAGHATTPAIAPDAHSVWAQYTLRLSPERRDAVAASMKREGVPTAVYYPRPLHHQPAYLDHPRAADGLARSERLAESVLSLPMHPYLTSGDQDRVVSALLRALG